MSRHLELTSTGQPARARRDANWWPWAWAFAALLWGWLTWRAAQDGWPLLIVTTTTVAVVAAYTCGRGTAHRANQEDQS